MKEETLRKGSGILGNIISIKDELSKIDSPDYEKTRISHFFIRFYHNIKDHRYAEKDLRYEFDSTGKINFDKNLNMSEKSKDLIQYFVEAAAENIKVVLEKELRKKEEELEKLQDTKP
jgi:hypothetical protein